VTVVKEPDPSRVTIRDVACEAGVAISTVSHAFSGRRRTSSVTRDRVLAAAATLGYEPNPAARSLRTGRSGLIGLILRPRDAVHGSGGGTETFIRLTGAVATEVLDHKLGLVHVPDILDPTAQRVPMDGCIVVSPYGGDEVLAELLHRGLPVVTAEEDPDRTDFPWAVVLDHVGAVTELLDRLQLQGAQRIMLLTGTEDNAWNRRAREAYLLWADCHQMVARHAELYEGFGADGAARFIEAVLTADDRPDAIVAASSRFAAGIADAAARLRIAVPDEVMVASLTDSNFTRSHVPQITAVDLALEDLGRAAVDLMLRQLAGEPPPAHRALVRPTLHWRASSTRTTTYPATSVAVMSPLV